MSIEAYNRLRPMTTPAGMVGRVAARAIREAARTHFRGWLLEIGCGSKTKGLLVGEFVERHIGLDLADCIHGVANIDVCGSALELPFADASFDCVLSTAVLEHLEMPGTAIREAFRALKPGGVGVFTAPLFWHLHEEPRDFFRYTKYGLRFLFEDAGYEVLRMEPLGGFWITFGSEFNYYIQRFAPGPLRLVYSAWVAFANRLCPLLDRGPLRDERFSWMTLVVARRPEKSA